MLNKSTEAYTKVEKFIKDFSWIRTKLFSQTVRKAEGAF